MIRLRGFSKALAVLLLAAPLAVTGTASSEELEAVVVKASPDRGFLASPSADGPWFAWNHWKGGKSNLFVQRGDEPRIRVNLKGKKAFYGALYRRTLVYEQSPSSTDQYDTDLFRYNLRTGQRTKFPDLVNTRRGYESEPTLSGGASGRYLLFDRYTYLKADRANVYKVMLYDRRTKSLQVLAKSDDGARAGQVNFPWAVWVSAKGPYAVVFRYNIRRDTVATVTRFEARGGTDTAISSDGTVYVDKKPAGGNIGIVKYPLKAPDEVVYPYPGEGWELFVDDRAKARHIYFRDSSNQEAEGIYKIIDPLP